MIRSLLDQPRTILLTSHMNPDGDAIGASLALLGYLRKKGHTVNVMIPDPDPGFLHWMPFHNQLMVYSLQEEQCMKAIEQADLIFSVDYNALSRLNRAEEPVRQSRATKILLDHHTNPSADYNLKISITKTSSTSELVYDFIDGCGDAGLVDQDIAACIYTGIITDTGSFSYACNYVRTFEITAALYRTGIDGEHIHRLVYDTFSENRLRLLGYSISEKLVVLHEYNAAYIHLSKEDLDRFNYQIGDTEDIVNYGLCVEGINFAALFMERDDIVKVSLRSKGNFAVNAIAKQYFGGGGHRNAAGANCTTTLEETVAIFRNLLPEYRDALKSVY